MPKIVFVDDEEDIRTVVYILLNRAGYEVWTGTDASFVDDIERVAPPDLYLLDRRLGNTDALEICCFLKSHPKTRHIPVVMISADPAIKDVYKNAGADAFIGKPFDAKNLLDTIASLLPGAKA